MNFIGKKLLLLQLCILIFFAVFDVNSFAMSNSDVRAKIISILYDNGGKMNCDFDGYVNTSGRHEGIDFYCGYGKSVNSITDGVVVRISKGAEGSSGLSTISIYNSKFDKSIIYLHTAPVSDIKEGDKISQGKNSYRIMARYKL